jgi:hypothetical protein
MTQQEIDALFRRIKEDDAFARELRKEARDIYAVAKDLEAFDNTLKGFFGECLRSITVAGITPKPFALALLIMFVLGKKFAGGIADAPKIESELTPEQVDFLRREIDEHTGGKDE